ncbi:MAG TPA: molybdenum cofactor biosynthesis protein MoaE [Gemmatimonadaceae bacterium]|jgi:molybdopterin synthase catalytic subunit|nr:molybdenum cofactor biosynthesis protein MoaE [Gemmatimonadaceae bacterium]
MTPLATLVRAPIDVLALVEAVSSAANGAVLLFLGAVRQVNDGRDVTGIDYAAYEGMALRELQAIAEEAAVRFDSADVRIVHRLGELGVEEVSVAIAVAHAHRDAAYAASRWVIEELKRRVPIWKREHYVDGTREWVDPAGRVNAEPVR